MQEFNGANVVLTGATGFIGRAVWDRLARAQANVFAVARDEAALRSIGEEYSLPATPLIADLARPDQFLDAIRELRPDVIINTAGYGVAPDERASDVAEMLNAQLPGWIAQAAAENQQATWRGQAFVHVGSGFEYGSVDGPVDEHTAAHPQNNYAETKLRGTEAVSRVREQTGLRCTTARVFTVYGPGEHPHRLLPSLLRAAHAKQPVDLTAGLQERDFTFVGDVAEGILRLAIARDVPPVVNVATGRSTSIRAFAEEVLRAAGAPPDLVNFGAIPTRPDEVRQGPVATAQLMAVTGWVPKTSVADGIRATVEAYQVESRVLR